jgi:hypothetical protein
MCTENTFLHLKLVIAGVFCPLKGTPRPPTPILGAWVSLTRVKNVIPQPKLVPIGYVTVSLF